mmetsp:Transcript_9218/g.18537  ORF Transcript_9218/g.18537 Transcript_9218/m.18537 type:complete len:83 (+) Transcript_9218:2518-2766(+)
MQNESVSMLRCRYSIDDMNMMEDCCVLAFKCSQPFGLYCLPLGRVRQLDGGAVERLWKWEEMTPCRFGTLVEGSVNIILDHK